MSADIENLKQELVDAINALDDTVTKEELLSLVLSVKEATLDRIVSVATVDDLPVLQTEVDIYDFPSGSIFFVESLNVLVMSCKEKWIGLDGRLLRNDGLPVTVYTWGGNFLASLGDGTTTNKSSPVTVIGGITNWSQISISYHSFGVTEDGIAYGWGSNGDGRIGDGTSTTRSSPVTIVGGITNWKQIEAGFNHSIGLTKTGLIYTWGPNAENGQLGNGTTISNLSPTTIVGGITNWTQISSKTHTLALTSDGTLYAWGYGQSGRLGDGTTITKSSPVTVIGGITDWKQISVGTFHSLALRNDGSLYAWGSNSGTHGDGTTIAKSSPTSISGISNWKKISAGDSHNLGLTEDGILYAWGSNTNGRLGDGTATVRSSPVTVVGGITNWKEIIAARSHSFGLTEDGILYAWGSNSNGRLGDDTIIQKSSPVTVVGGITNWTALPTQITSGNGGALK